MWTFFLVLACIGICIIAVHVTLEFNNLERDVTELFNRLKRHYENS